MKENTNRYMPRPVDTGDVALPPELDALAEEIAKNVHEVWSLGRMRDGWTYGRERNDALKLIMKLGFRIVKD